MWIGFLVTFIILSLAFVVNDEDAKNLLIIFTIVALIVTLNMAINKPSAMDVYAGKTTMEYTIVDGVKVDSTVVYKKK